MISHAINILCGIILTNLTPRINLNLEISLYNQHHNQKNF